MSPAPQWLTYLGLVVVAAPFLLTVMLGISSMLDRRPSERTMVRWVQTAVDLGPPGRRRRADRHAGRWARGTSRSTWGTGSPSRGTTTSR